jgi:hypothetical protein
MDHIVTPMQEANFDEDTSDSTGTDSVGLISLRKKPIRQKSNMIVKKISIQLVQEHWNC